MTSSFDIVTQNNQALIDFIELKRIPSRRECPNTAEQVVQGIIKRVNDHGDKALLEYTRWFDKLDLSQMELRISSKDLTSSYSKVTDKQVDALKEMISRVRRVAERTLVGLSFQLDIDGTQITSSYRPLERVGCYVPGGEAAYPSSLIMCAIPAQVAGVSQIAVCTAFTATSAPG